MTFTIQRFRFHVLPMRLRFPFKYGIASMTVVPHVFVYVDLNVDGREVSGLSSEGLALKWFTKNPETPFEADLCEMIELPKSVHPWFVGCQFHPEFTSSPRSGHPLFTSFVRAAIDYKGGK